MSSEAGTRITEEQVRLLSHQVVDRVSEVAGDKLHAAEAALEEAPNDAVRQAMVETAAGAPDEVTAAFVRAAVCRGSTELARAAADLLLDIKTAEHALPVIAECVHSADTAVGRRGVEALETLTDPAVLGVLSEIIETGNEPLRRAATNTFGLIVGSKYHPLKLMLLDQLEDPKQGLAKAILTSQDVGMRREIAQVLGFAGTDQALPMLEALANDSDTQARREAVIALAAQRTDAALEALKRKLDDPDDVVAISVLDAVATRLRRDSSETLEVLKVAVKHR